jgi:hypothetical protein
MSAAIKVEEPPGKVPHNASTDNNRPHEIVVPEEHLEISTTGSTKRKSAVSAKRLSVPHNKGDTFVSEKNVSPL